MNQKCCKHPILMILAGMIALGGCSAGLKKGEIAPNFKLPSLEGEIVNLSDARGDVVLLSFWAVGCRPCREESAHLRELHDRYANRGLKIIAVNAWNEPEGMVRKFAAERKLEYVILLDGAGVHTELYGGRGVPDSYLIDRSGVIQYALSGYNESAGRRLERRVIELLK